MAPTTQPSVLSSSGAGDPLAAGGKAAQLAALTRAGLPVPPWFCIAAGAFTGPAELSPGFEQAIAAAISQTFGDGERVAVRSSAIGEDSARDSFAGQLETFLNVPKSAVLERVRACHGSAFGPRASAYRTARGLDASDVRAAVIVQRMVDARCSGVMFTRSPSSPDRATIVAGPGLGEGIVLDRVETDTFDVMLATGAVTARRVGRKTHAVAMNPAGGTHLVEIAGATCELPAVSDSEIAALCDLGRSVERTAGPGQDVEWAIDVAGRLWLLQARPITASAPIDGPPRIWDNANIVESYPGISSPLTFSFARSAYERTFRESSRMLGVPEETIRENWSAHANLVGRIDGRIYYDILNWYRLLTLVPGFESVLPAWERALGIPERSIPPPAGSPSPPGARLRVIVRLVERYLRHGENVARFRELFRDVKQSFDRVPIETLSARDLVDRYEWLSDRLLAPYAISVVNDLFAQQLFAAAARLVERWGLGDASTHATLLSGIGGMESVEPVRSLLAIAELVRARPGPHALVTGASAPREIWNALHAHPDAQEICDALHRHVAAYGDRTLQELKLETASLEEDPSWIVALLRSYVRHPPALAAAGGVAGRRDAEAEVSRRLASHPLRRAIFRHVLARGRAAIAYREDLRLLRSRAFGMVKRVFRAIGASLARDGVIDAPGDIFHLTVEEIARAARQPPADLRALVDTRKREDAHHRTLSPPPRIVTGSARHETELPPATPGAREIRGIGCAPGIARGPARIIDRPAGEVELLGRILVAPLTDPGWIFLMVAASGLVSERGSILSHTAIVGRELGIPTVVDARGATTLIHDGQPIAIDGRTGIVRLLDP